MKYDSTIDYRNDPAISIRSPIIVCRYCSGLKLTDESNCMIKLDDIFAPPEPLKPPSDGNHPKHIEFIRNCRRYNNVFQITSSKSKRVFKHGFMSTFKVQGHVSYLPHRSNDHKFLKIYFIADPEIPAVTRCHININY